MHDLACDLSRNVILTFSESHFPTWPVREQFFSLPEPIAWQFLRMTLTYDTQKVTGPTGLCFPECIAATNRDHWVSLLGLEVRERSEAVWNEGQA